MNTAENIINPNNPKVKNVTLSLSHVGLQKNAIQPKELASYTYENYIEYNGNNL